MKPLVIVTLVKSFLVIFVSALPKVNDMRIAPGSGAVIPSTVLKHTDHVCYWLNANWIAERKDAPQRKRYKQGKFKPLVLSTRASDAGNYLIKHYCFDNRTNGRVIRAIAEENEVAESGPYYLQCDSRTERIRILDMPRDGDDANEPDTVRRKAGECIPRTRNPQQSAPNVIVSAGSSNCVDAETASRLANLNAFMMADDVDLDDQQATASSSSEWLSIQEIGTSKYDHIENLPLLSISVEPSKKAVYRACGKQKAGYGNARLYLVAV